MKLSILFLTAAMLFCGCVSEHDLLHPSYNFSDESDMLVSVGDFAGGAVVGDAMAGYCSISFEIDEIQTDDAGHAKTRADAVHTNIRWLALPTDSATGDTIQWDGSKYVKVATEVVTVVTDVSFDAATGKLTKQTRTVRVIVATEE